MGALAAALESVGPLRREAAAHPELRCKACGGSNIRDFDLVDANKICSEAEPYQFGLSGVGIRYLRCGDCGFVFTTDFDSWDDEAFVRHIYNVDYVKVDGDYLELRPQRSAEHVALMLRNFPELRILDFGAGIGLFAEELRRRGFTHVAAYDPLTSLELPTGTFDVVTCIETIEHTPDPVATLQAIARLLAPDGAVLMQTAMQPPDIDQLRGRWWYIAPRNGHISIFGYPSMSAAARRAGLTLFLGNNRIPLLSHRGAGPALQPLIIALGGGGGAVAPYLAPPAHDDEGVMAPTVNWFDAAVTAAAQEALRRRPSLLRSGLGRLARFLSPGRSARACADEARIAGQWARAARFYADALITEPGGADLWNRLAEMLEQAGRLDEAALARRRAAEPGRPGP